MKWKRVPSDFLSEKTFLIIRDETEVSKDVGKGSPKSPMSLRKGSPRSKVKTDTWPPKMKRSQPLLENMERPRTASLEKPSVLDPDLVDKLDMSLLSKELLCDSMTRFQLGKTISGGTSLFSTRRRQSVAVHELPRQQKCSRTAQNTWITGSLSARQKRPNFEQINDTRHSQYDTRSLESPRMEKQARIASQDINTWKKQNSDGRKLDDNNNRNGNPGTNKITSLTMVKKKGSRTTITPDLEVFTGSTTTRLAPEPCKTCGRSDQPERFHSHPKGAPSKPKDAPIVTNNKPKISVPKSIQKPVALNFRSDKNRNKSEDTIVELKPNSTSPRDVSQNDIQGNRSRGSRPLSAPGKKGPKTVTCYICGREFGSASFPIHEPRCMQKWERENNLLPVSQRRPVPKRPSIEIHRNEWNDAAWEESQAQLLPCSRCGRTFLPERLPIHERSCKAIPKNIDSGRSDTSEKQSTHTTYSNPTTVACQICGRNFGSRSIKIHEPQCMKRLQMENGKQQSIAQQGRRDSIQGQKFGSTSAQEFSPSSNSTAEASQKRTVTCYICGRDFGSLSIAIHEPQCLKRWQLENDKLPPSQRRPIPQKPDVVYVYDQRTGNATVDNAAMAEASWKSHLKQLVPCKRCGRTFNPDRVDIHEKSCKGMR